MRLALSTSLIALVAAFTLSGHPAIAQSSPPMGNTGGYGAAGCGLGSIIFGSKPGFVQVFAATTNATFGTQTFGITSGTSNCGSTARNQMTAKAFIETNREAFAKDVSRGRGETIDNLAVLGGCGDASKVGAILQKNFRVIFPNANVSNTEVSAKVVSLLKQEPTVACSRFI